ncbi:MAG: AAA family ATPase [Achromobacter sp.]|uniref:AAA family ATPase n=1 Tax=Achromobacter sp. TaxID=134375 RepID=UPI003D025BC9
MSIEQVLKLSSAFSPSAPIDQATLFSGRIGQLTDVLNALNQKGQHAILFGERGVGKTSLARVLSRGFLIDGKPLPTATINCDPTMTFSGLWKKLLREVPINFQRQPAGFTGAAEVSQASLADYLPDPVTPDDVRHLLSKMGKILLVIDELDRIEDPSVASLLADTIKTLSDHAVDATVLLVGVADSVDTLINEHQSVERALVQVRMPRMSRIELFQIIDKGLSQAGMTSDTDARLKIAALSQGLPHYTHLLAQNAGQRAAGNDRTVVTIEDVRTAIDNALAKAQQSTVNAYHKATNSPRDNLYPQVLLACAMAKQDALGYFAAVDVRQPLCDIMGRAYDIPAFSQHLNKFCEISRGPVLQRTGTARRFRFRFVNPLLQPYVLMDGIRKSLISEAAIIG